MHALKIPAIQHAAMPTLQSIDTSSYLGSIDERRYYITTRVLDYHTTINRHLLGGDADMLLIPSKDVSPLLRDHLSYGGNGSFIFDMQGINTFLYGKAKIFNDQAVRKIALALGYLQSSPRHLRIGAAGARGCRYQPGGEVVEYSYIRSDGSGTSYSQSGYLPKGSEFSRKVPLHSADQDYLRDERTVYSHTVWLPLQKTPDGSICLRIATHKYGVDLLDVVHRFVTNANIQAYGIQIAAWLAGTSAPTVIGRVLRHLPHGRIKTLKQARDIASEQIFPLYSGQTAVFFGTNYRRKEKDWEEFRAGKPYEPRGHIHGFLVSKKQRHDQHNLFHLRSLLLTPDTACQVVISPVRQIVRAEPVLRRGQQIISKTNGDVVASIDRERL